jgi:hypothetical protein
MQKRKKVRLTGKQLAQLNTDIHERDGHICIISECGRYVLPGEKFHHEKNENGKEDKIEAGCLLCYYCHQERHFGISSIDIKKQCKQYLSSLYPEYWADIRDRYGAGEE